MLVLVTPMFATQIDLTMAVVAAGTVNTINGMVADGVALKRLYAFDITCLKTRLAPDPCSRLQQACRWC